MAGQKHPTLGNGKICYLEIPAADVNASAAFYETVFGWNIRRRGDGEIAFDDGVGEVSGTWVSGRRPAEYPGVIISIMVENIERTMETITANGGRITQQVGMDAPEITAQFSDPAGNIFALYQDASIG